MAFIDKIVKFHTFSKSTVRDNLTLGEAVNPSGHTVVSSQVRTDDIPAFIDTFQDTKAAALTWAATNVDANARHNDILYYGGKFNMGFSNPKCLIRVAKQVVDGKLVDLPADQHTWADFTITDKSYLANAAGKNVIAIHKDADICYVHGDNNAAVNSNQNSAFVRKSDGTFLDHFVAPTDQILGGQPSLGYGLCLFKSGTTKALTEGEETGKNNYIGNTFAGLIHFMDTRSEAADATDNYKAAGFSVNCFEYIGDKLDTTLGNIREEIQDIVGVTMEGVVASVGTTTEATAAGISVDSSSKTSPKIGITTGSVTAGETKLVSGGAVKTYVDTTALANGGSIASAIDAAVKIDEIKVKVGSGEATALVASDKSVTIEIPDVPAATVTEGEVTTDGFAKASDAVAIAQKEIDNALETSGAVAAAIDSAVTIDEIKVQVGSGTAVALVPDESKSVTIQIPEVQAATTSASGVVTISSGDAIATSASGNAAATVGAVAKTREAIEGAITASQTTLQGNIDTLAGRVTATETAVNTTLPKAIEDAQAAAEKTATDAVAALKSELTTGEGSLSGKVTALEDEVSTIKETMIPDAQAAAEKVATDGIAALKKTLEEGVIATAQATANQGVTDAAAALAEAQKRISKVTEGTDSSLLTVSTSGTEVTITLDSDVATKTHVAGEIKTVTDAATTLTGRITAIETSLGEGGTTAKAIADAKKAGTDAATAVTTLKDTDITAQTVSGAGISVTLDGTVGAPTLTGSVTTASYTSATGENTLGSWTDEAKVATGAAVKAAIADLNAAHTKDIKTVTAAVEALSTSGFERVIVTELPTGNDIKLNAIYLIKNTNSEAGEYIEHIYVQSLGKFEQIGSTKTDLSEYAKTADVTSAIATAKGEAIADAKGKVDALAATHAADKAELEGAISGVSQVAASTQTQVTEFITTTYTTDKKALEDSIKAVSDKVGETDVNAQIAAKIDAIGTGATQGAAGVTLTQSKGVVTLSVVPGSVAEGNASVVTGGAVFTAVEAAKSVANSAQTSADKKLASIGNDGDARIIIGTPTADGDTKSVTIKLASTVASTTDGTAYSKTEADAAVKVAKDAADAADAKADTKIAAVEVTTDSATHLGAHHISATTDASKKVTVAVSCSDEWEYTGAALTGVTTVINGKMSDGKTIDDANLTKAESMFAGNTTLTTYVGSLGKLTNGKNMFKGCTGLTTFVADLTSLTDGTGMFEGCALTEESLMYIVDSLPVTTGKTITVGVAASVTNKATYAAEALTKGWKLA